MDICAPGNRVVIPYISMHGSTEKMVSALVSELADLDIQVMPFNMLTTDLGQLAVAAVDAATIILASPTVLGGAHPFVLSAGAVVGLLKPKAQFVGVMGSYSWGGRMPDQLADTVKPLRAHMIEPVLVEGEPDTDDFARIHDLALNILNLHKNAGII